MATDICLPVLKYSHAIGMRDNTVPWTHITASDLFVIVKGVATQVVDGRLTLRIVQGTKVLESVDIASYIDNATETRRRAEQAGVAVQIEQLPIFGITKESILAIRYRLDDGKGRRIQLRLQNQAECRQIVDCFMRRGMQFQEQRPRTAARPQTARPPTDFSQARPLTMQTPSPYFDSGLSPTKPSPFTQQEVLEAGSLSQYHTSPERYTTFEKPESAAREMPPPTVFSRDVVAVPRDVVPERPTTSQIYHLYTTPSQQSQHDVIDMGVLPPGPAVERRSSASEISTLEAIREAPAEQRDSPPHHIMGTNPPPYKVPQPNETWSSTITAPANSAFLSSDPAEPRPETQRPSTATSTAFPDTLEHEIPPRRELPFHDHESRSSASERLGSRPVSALTLPPLPKPTLAKEGSVSPIRQPGTSLTKDVSPSRPGPASPSKRSFAVQEEESVRPGIFAGVVNQSLSREPSPKRQVSPANPTVTNQSPVNDLLYGRKPLAERSPNSKVPRLSSLVDAPHETISPPASPPKSPDRAMNASLHDPTIRAHAALTSPTHDPDAASLEAFAAQTESERQAALEEFFIANWDNENFITLCEDVEKCWRRIALGL